MRASVLTDYGDVEKLELRDISEPHPGPGELKVRVAAASINPIDWKLRSGHLKSWMPIRFPYILGFDASGRVVEVGEGVSGFKVGDPVLGLGRHSHAEYCTAPSPVWTLVPPGLDLKDAAALPLVGLTGVQLVETGVAPKRGDVVLITGAVGNVGRAAIFAARGRGARVIAGVRGSQVSEAEKLGVERVVVLSETLGVEDLPPLDAIADTVGGEVAEWLLPRLKRGGVLASVVGEPPSAKKYDITVHAVSTQPDSKRLAALAQDVVAGRFAIPIAKRFELAQVREAFRVAEGGSVGKVLLIP
jgi:NADPH:quinone reductase-like Zn-dependent oxidoreductase